MGIDELRAALTENPSNTRAFQTEFDALLETAEWDEIQDFIHQLADIVGEGRELENLLRVADFRARSKAAPCLGSLAAGRERVGSPSRTPLRRPCGSAM